jgi:hypothetical protein
MLLRIKGLLDNKKLFVLFCLTIIIFASYIAIFYILHPGQPCKWRIIGLAGGLMGLAGIGSLVTYLIFAHYEIQKRLSISWFIFLLAVFFSFILSTFRILCIMSETLMRLLGDPLSLFDYEWGLFNMVFFVFIIVFILFYFIVLILLGRAIIRLTRRSS